MTEPRVAEYVEYYRARARRYAGDPHYPETARAEAALCQAVELSTSVEDMQRRVVEAGLNVECGRALLRDQANARAALYAETGEDVRAQFPAEVLSGLPRVNDAAGLASLASAAATRNSAAVTADEMHRLWSMSLTALENIEVWRTAAVPPRWRAELDGFATEAAAATRAGWHRVVAEAQHHAPGWQFSDATARADRHRRLVAAPDEVFEARLAEHHDVARGGA